MYKEFFEYIKSRQKVTFKTMTVDSDPVSLRIHAEQSKILESIAIIQQLTSDRDSFAMQLLMSTSPDFKEEKSFSMKMEQSKERKQEKSASPKEKPPAKIEKGEEPSDVHLFERHLSGGYLPTLNTFLSEETVRSHKIKHGDLVKVYPRGKSIDGKVQYACWLEEEKNCEPPKDRIQFDKCLIEVEASRLVCRKSKGKFLRVNGEIFTMLVSDDEANKYSLKPGDIVDVAVNAKDLKKACVIWKHAIQSKTGSVTETDSRPKKSQRIKKQKEKLNLTLKDKKILIVSNKNDRSRYEGEIVKRGGQLLMGDSDLLAEQMNALVSKADLAIVVTSKCSHDAMFSSRDTAKALKVPIVFAKSDGTTGIIHLAEQIFEPIEVSPLT